MNKHSWLKDMVLFSVAFLLALNCFAWNGSGTYEDPWQIASGADIAAIAQGTKTNSYSGKYFIQTTDISFVEGYTWEMYVIGQLALGDTWYPFSGTYDGDGYEVQGLNITASTSQAVTNAYGLFGYCKDATIENVTVRGSVNVSAAYNANACVSACGIIGLSIGGTFAGLNNHCSVGLKITGAPDAGSSTAYSSPRYIAAGVGYLGNAPSTTITYIGLENKGDIYIHGANFVSYAAGCMAVHVVSNSKRVLFQRCSNYGHITASGLTSGGMERNPIVAGIATLKANINGTYNYMASCSNFGEITCSNSVNVAGIGAKGVSYGNCYLGAYFCTNYAVITRVNTLFVNRCYTAGVISDQCDYQDAAQVHDNVNFGFIKVSGSGGGNYQIGGVEASNKGNDYNATAYGNKNFGDIEANCPNANSIIVGGVTTAQKKVRLKTSINFGNITANTKGSVLLGGVASSSAQNNQDTFVYDCVNFGSITATGNYSTNYSPCVGGVFAATRLTGASTRNISVSNCYNLGRLNLNLNASDCYGGIYGVANSYGNYGVTVKNCYSLIGEGQPLIGAVNAEAAAVSVENCVGIVLGKEGKVAASVTGSNNWSQAGTTIVSYADGYKTPSLCDGNITSGFFTQADKTAAPYDLILPINLALFPTQTDDVKALHNFTKALGFKRYKRINR